jgi:F-type H+-transporting ATPase subunit epsilon
MAELFTLNLVTPEKLFLTEEVEMVVVPGVDGAFGAMRDHAPLISMIQPGTLEIHTGKEVKHIFIAGGYAEISGANCTILAEELVELSDLNKSSLAEQLKQVEFDLEHAESDKEKARLESSLAIINQKIVLAA